MSYRFTILGCGSSPGTPRINGDWGAADPTNPRNRRRRASMLVERIGPEGTTTVLIDTSPDLREQMLMANVQRIDGVLFTHPHADHVHGIDDLRQYAIIQRERIQTYANAATLERLRDLGNSVLVVEHDEDAILTADHVIDMGPRAGVHGGEVIGHGKPDDLIRPEVVIKFDVKANPRS